LTAKNFSNNKKITSATIHPGINAIMPRNGLFEKNIGTHLSIDETALSNDELHTVVTNKAAKGGKGAIVAMIRGTESDKVTTILMAASWD
jgi:hypothetical protein